MGNASNNLGCDAAFRGLIYVKRFSDYKEYCGYQHKYGRNPKGKRVASVFSKAWNVLSELEILNHVYDNLSFTEIMHVAIHYEDTFQIPQNGC